VITPEQKIARFTIKVGITINTAVILSVAYFPVRGRVRIAKV
jgi:hypothetical protein